MDVNADKVCRWETGITPPPREAIARYEEILDLPTRSMSSVADLIWREARHPLPRGARTSHSDKLDGHAFSVLIDRATSGDTLPASDWDSLTMYLANDPGLMLWRGGFEALAERLLVETLATRDCLLWLTRYEAYGRLLTHERARSAAIATCIEVTSDRSSFIAVEPMSLLGGVRDTRATKYIVQQLANPTNEQTFYGALLASGSRGQAALFDPGQANLVRQIALQSMTPDLASHYAEVAVVGRHVSTLLGSKAARADDNRRARNQSLYSGPRDQGNQRAELVNRILLKTWERVDDIEDDLLPELIESLIFGATINVRLESGLLLLQSPYRRALASAIGAQLSDIRTANQRITTTRSLLAALRTLGTDAERRTVETYVLSGAHPAIIEAAVFAIGHVGGASSSEFWRRAVDKATKQYQETPSATNSRTVAEVMYALGVDRQTGILRELAYRNRDQDVRNAAQWWLSLPSEIYNGVLR